MAQACRSGCNTSLEGQIYICNEKHKCKLLVLFDLSIVTFGLKTPLHALGEHTGIKIELDQTNVKSQGFIYKTLFQHKLH